MGELPPDLQQCMRFSPSKEKAISILLSKITGNCNGLDFIFEFQKSNLEPWDLKAWLDLCGIKMGGYPEWWFFSAPNRNRKGSRARATYSGFWKVTAEKEEITLDSGLIGERYILVFYEGRGNKGKKTNWKIHEYSIPGQNAFVLCRLSNKDEKSIKDPYINDARPAVSSPSASNYFLEDISEPEQGSLASVLFSASDVHPITTPEKCDGTLYATATSVKCDDKHLSAHPAETQLGELTTTNDDSQIEDMIIRIYLFMSDLLPDQPPYCHLSSPSSPITNENFPNTFGNQKNLTSVSIKDNGSCGGLDAKLANAPFESTFLNSGEISEREATSGLLNMESHMVWMGGSPNQIEGSDYIPKNY